jgi:hypothetical protein
MAISEQFKLLNLKKIKMRKLCTDEVGGVKMKKKKVAFCNFLYCSSLDVPWALRFKDDL